MARVLYIKKVHTFRIIVELRVQVRECNMLRVNLYCYNKLVEHMLMCILIVLYNYFDCSFFVLQQPT